MARPIAPGSTSVSLLLFLQDTASTTGGGKTGLAYNTASLTCYYVRSGSAAVAISLVTQTVTGAWSSGGFVEVDATNMPGVYRLDVPNAVFAAGVRSVVVMLKGASGMAPLPIGIDLGAQVDVFALSGDSSAADSAEAFFDGSGYIGLSNIIGTVMVVAGDVQGNVDGTVGGIGASGLIAIADAILKRDWTAVSGEASRSLLNALRFLRNKWSVSGVTLTVTKEDDATSAWTATLSTDAGADPVTGSDPA